MNNVLLWIAAALALLLGDATRDEVFRLAGITLRGANRSLQRWVTVPLLFWVMVILIAATRPWSHMTMIYIVAVPIAAFLVTFAFYPALLVALGTVYKKNADAHQALNALGIGLAWVMFVALGVRVVRVYVDPELAFAAGVLATIGGLWTLGQAPYWSVIIKTWGKRAIAAAVITIIVILIMGGRDRAEEKAKRAKDAVIETGSAVKGAVVGTATTLFRGSGRAARTDGVPIVQLTYGEGIVETVPGSREYAVPACKSGDADRCWTKTLRRPRRGATDHFWIDQQDTIDIMEVFANCESVILDRVEPTEVDPNALSSRVWMNSPERGSKCYVTGYRLRNPNATPTVITLHAG